MRRPVVTALIALAVLALGLVVGGSLTDGKTRLEATARFDASPERVWPFFADLRGWPDWCLAKDGSRITYATLIKGYSSGPEAVRRTEDSFGSWWEERVTYYEPNRRLELVGQRVPNRENWRQEISLKPVGPDVTEVTWTLEYEVNGPIMKLINKSRDEKRFRGYMEGGLATIGPKIPSVDEWGPPSIEAPITTVAPLVVTPASAAPEAPASSPAPEMQK